MVTVLSVVSTVLALTGNLLVNLKKKIGFVIWILSNIGWIVVNIVGEMNYPMVFMYLVYVVLNIQGFVHWKRTEKNDCCM